ncbi:DUF2721 domain-containing protein [Algibacillus agarilyticus]|uniref:DUF2721 domain-containing protein n=1 Tax=Algibacillus agarilyticus TaxID=2234133 RepID=UPI000DCFE438|nr:DUF2721 domain-containing protein [Algibacillus agarilyticus]
MLDVGMTTPVLLFPAISLLLLAYTNRFIVIANLTRSLYKQYKETADDTMREQIEHLRLRIKLIRHKQLWGVASFILCTFSMCFSLLSWVLIMNAFFALSLLCLIVSLCTCFYEVYISGYALNKQLESLGKIHDV